MKPAGNVGSEVAVTSKKKKATPKTLDPPADNRKTKQLKLQKRKALASGAHRKESSPSKHPRLIHRFDPSSHGSLPPKDTSENAETTEAASNLLEIAKFPATELGSLSFMKELASTSAAGEGLFAPTPPCPSVKKIYGLFENCAVTIPKEV